MTNNIINEANVTLIAYTSLVGDAVEELTGFTPEDWNGDNLAEVAGRACYESWTRPNPKTATNKGYLGHILEVGHGSVLEHASATFYLTGVSRSLTHELVRHRHLSYSQLSQRYVDSKDAGIVVPPEMRDSSVATRYLQNHMSNSVREYEAHVKFLEGELKAEGVTGTEARKRARQAARAVMPNMTETRIVVTGNYRAWREVIDRRASQHADTEIRAVAIKILRIMQEIAPNSFQDFRIFHLDDGTEAARREDAP